MLYRIGKFELDRACAELRGPSGENLPLARKPLELLCYLVQERARAVPREELLQAVWSDVTVSDASLSTAVRQLRRALGERAGDSMIRTVSRHGYRFVGPVQELEAPAARNAEAPVRNPHGDPAARHPIVGRDEVLAEIDGLLGGLAEQRGSTLVLRGDPGLGKTRLLHEAATRAEAQGLRALRVRCQPLAGAPALWPFIQLLRQLARACPAPGGTPPRSDNNELVSLLQRLGTSYRGTASAHDASTARFQLFDAFLEALSAAAHSRPLLVLMDDLHHADASSQELLAFVSHQIDALPLGLLIGTRDIPQANGPGKTALLRLGPQFVLAPLDTHAARDLITTLAGRPLGTHCIDTIVANARGNPLILRELLRAALEALPDACGEPAEDWLRQLPGSLRALVARRLEPLSAACRELLEIAACAGDEFSGPRVLALMSQPAEDLPALLAEAEAAGFISAASRSTSRYHFDHGLIRSAIYEDCEPRRRALWHGRIAQQIERDNAEADALAGHLVHHYDAARMRAKAARHSQSAATGASTLGAHDTAAQHLQRMEHPDYVSTIDGSERVELLLRSAAARAGSAADEDELRAVYRHAFQLARELDSPELIARAALGFAGARLFKGTAVGPWPPLREELSLLEEARNAQAETSVWSVLIEAHQGSALSCTDRVADAERTSKSAVLRAEALGDPRTLCEAMLHRARSLARPGVCRQRVAVAQEALFLARRAGLDALRRDAEFEHAAGRLAGGELSRSEFDELCEARSAEEPIDQLRRNFVGVMRAHMRGEVDEAMRLIALVRRRVQWIHPTAGQRLLPVFEMELSRARGTRETLDILSTGELHRFGPAGWMGYAWLFALLDRGRLPIARAAYALGKRALPNLPSNRYWFTSIGILLWGAHIFDDKAGAQIIHERLLPYAKENISGSDMMTFHGPVAHCLGVAALVCDRFAQAEAHFDDAEESCEKIGATVSQLLTRKYRALLRIERGRRTAGLQALQEVRGELLGRGLKGLAEDLDADLARCRG